MKPWGPIRDLLRNGLLLAVQLLLVLVELIDKCDICP